MEEIIKLLNTRKEQLKKECWSNQIRVNEINTIMEIIKNTPVAVTTDVLLTEKQLEQINNFLGKNY